MFANTHISTPVSAIIYLNGSDGQGGKRRNAGENVVKVAGRLSGNGVGYYKDPSWEYLSYGERRKIEIESEKLTRRMPKNNPEHSCNPVSGVAKVE